MCLTPRNRMSLAGGSPNQPLESSKYSLPLSWKILMTRGWAGVVDTLQSEIIFLSPKHWTTQLPGHPILIQLHSISHQGGNRCLAAEREAVQPDKCPFCSEAPSLSAPQDWDARHSGNFLCPELGRTRHTDLIWTPGRHPMDTSRSFVSWATLPSCFTVTGYDSMSVEG